jgi:hypothetical protein
MWLSDFIDDTKHQKHLITQLNAVDASTRKKIILGDQRIKLLEQASLYGDIDSMIKLGQYYAMKNDSLESLRWYVLGFEEAWMTHGTNHESTKRILRGELSANGGPLNSSRKTLEVMIMESITDVDGVTKRSYRALFESFRK